MTDEFLRSVAYNETMAKYKAKLTDWLPEKSPSRQKTWALRERPRKLYGVLNHKNAYESQTCFNCYELAAWYCGMCKIYYCKFEECKEVHEDEHNLSRLAGPPEG